jgi:tRNA threonylcarbamoyladenosine biosynthesis protein TsaE
LTTSRQPTDTAAFAHATALSLTRGSVLALVGELGAGKTQFVKGLAAGLGHTGEVTSPTFTLVHEYHGGRLPLYHFDFYRLERPDEALQLGLDEYLTGDGICVIEWADKFPDLLPPTARWLHFAITGDRERTITERA